MEFKPYYYQAFAESFILENPEAGLLLDMGMGKTVVSLTAADKLLNDYFAVSKVLVIAPLKPARETWPPEIKKWDHLRLSMILGSKAERSAACEREADIYVVNRENVVWLVDYYKSKWPFDMVIIDELSSFKSSKAQRFRALKKVRKYIKRIVGLTGTPSPNGLLDLWPEMSLLDEINALTRAEAEIGRAIDQYVEDPTLKQVLELRYLNCLKWEEIAVRMNLTFRWTMTLHKRALETFSAKAR